jgi:Sodium:dicarboxylate symporter family
MSPGSTARFLPAVGCCSGDERRGRGTMRIEPGTTRSAPPVLAAVTLSKRILLGLVAGVGIGLFLGERASFLELPAKGFVQLLQVTVLPYVVVSLVAGVARGEPRPGPAPRFERRARPGAPLGDQHGPRAVEPARPARRQGRLLLRDDGNVPSSITGSAERRPCRRGPALVDRPGCARLVEGRSRVGIREPLVSARRILEKPVWCRHSPGVPRAGIREGVRIERRERRPAAANRRRRPAPRDFLRRPRG